jgi:hypothetical protein
MRDSLLRTAKNITRGGRFAIIFDNAFGRAEPAFDTAYQPYFELSRGGVMQFGVWLAEAAIGHDHAR